MVTLLSFMERDKYPVRGYVAFLEFCVLRFWHSAWFTVGI